MANTLNFSNTTPAAPGGQTNVTFQVDASTTPNLSAYVPTQVNADWSAVSGTAQILNKPTIPAAQVSADWNAVSGVAQILNKPTLGTAAAQPTSAFDAAGAASAAVAAIPVFTASGASHAKGLVPDPGVTAGTTKFLREDSTWATPAGGGAVTTVFGRTGDVVAVATDYPAFVASGGSHAQGMVPDPGASAGTTKYLREDGTWAVAVQNSGAYTWSSAQTFSQTITFNLALIAKMFSTNCRTVVAATDTATVNTDHTLILNGVTTETLPASPLNGHKFYLVNIGGSAATVSGNGHNIWVAGASAATLSLAPNASIILQYDTTNTLWRQISAPLTASASQAGILSSADWSTFNGKQAALGYTPLAPANNLSDVSTPATALTNLGGASLSAANTFASAQTVTIPGAANGVLAAGVQIKMGTDATLGPLGVSFSASPSATGGARYGAIGVGDNAAVRPLVLNVSGSGGTSFGNVLVGSISDNSTDKLQVTGSGSFTGVVKVGSAAPALSTSAGVVGSMTWDSGFLYVCTAANTWKRVALTTF